MSEPENPESSLAGVDGCRAGWLVVLAHPLACAAHEHQVTICTRFDDVLGLLPTPAVSAVDIERKKKKKNNSIESNTS